MPAPEAAPGQVQRDPEPVESTSFSAIGAEIGALPRAPVEHDDTDRPPAKSVAEGAAEPPRRSALPPEETNFRVLTASSPKPTPYWLTALFTGGMACILLMPLIIAPGFRQQTQPWMSYCILLLAGGTLVWCLAGLAKEGPAKDRWLCLIGLALAVVAGIGGWVLRTPGDPYG